MQTNTQRPVDRSTDGPVGLIVAALALSGGIVFFLNSSWLTVGLWVAGAVAAVLWLFRAMPSRADWTPERAKQASRSRAIGLGLIALVAIFYIATMTRLKGNALNKPAPYIQQPIKDVTPKDLPKAK
jgi:uncharacterized membrane protein